jgi:transposase
MECLVVPKRKKVHDYNIPFEIWTTIKPLLPLATYKKKSGRPHEDDLKNLSGIFYVLLTGCQWKALPRIYGAPSTVHDRFQEWQKDGLFERMWQSIDGAMTKAPLGGAGTGANPTDRGKIGTKRSLLTDTKGIPLSIVADGANRHDKMLVKKTLDAIIFERPSLDEEIQNICMDKGL